VVPSNRLVDVSHGHLRLRPAKAGAVAPSIDVLFESAAAVFGPGLIAVILTGSGSDGSAGAWYVKEAGGAVVIENPATAMFPSMPSSISPVPDRRHGGPRLDRVDPVRPSHSRQSSGRGFG